ncbi:hypothetical protein HZC34_00095, partial [Candidatus Saganbacteria bacterium]|nr:hypothetical protein [Candidatus Saganbacteria bacterium]
MKRFIVLFLLLIGVLVVPALAAISDPVSSVVSADKHLYVPNQATNQILIYDASKDPAVLQATINLSGSPRGLALSPDGSKLYVSTTTNAYLNEYNVATGALTATFTGTALSAPRQIAVSPDGAQIYLVDSLANSIKVFSTSTHAYIASASVNVGVSGLYGIAVSSDNSMLAVTQRANPGSIYVYNIIHKADGTLSLTAKAGSPINAQLSSLVYPSFVAFSAQNDRIFARVSQYAEPYVDLLIYDAGNFSVYSSLSLIPSNESDPLNQFGETMAISSNGQYLYLTQYRTSTDEGETAANKNKVHAYKISTLQKVGTDWAPRTDWKLNLYSATNISGIDGIIQPNIPPSIDGACAVADGSRVWFTSSEDGHKGYSKWTGFTNSQTGNLDTPIPGAPTIKEPNSSNALSFAGPIVWSGSGPYFNVNYKATDESVWTQIEVYTSNTQKVLPAELQSNKFYVISARMNNGTNWGPYAYSVPFKKAGPIISEIVGTKKEANNNTVEFPVKNSSNDNYDLNIYETYKIKGSGFGNVDLENFDDKAFQIRLKLQKNTDLIIPKDKIYSWSNTGISFGVPKRDAGKMDLWILKDWDLTVRAISVDSTSVKVNILPSINTITPVSGPAEGKVVIKGAFTTAYYATPEVGFADWSNPIVNAKDVGFVSGGDTDDTLTLTVPQGLKETDYILMVTQLGLSTVHYTGKWDTPTLFKVVPPGTNQPTPVINRLYVDTDTSESGSKWEITTEAVVYDHVKIAGTGFLGTSPALNDGERASDLFNVAIATYKIRDDKGDNGLQVYGWTDTEIDFGIPRRIGTDRFIESGPNSIVVTANGKQSNPVTLNIKPRVYSVDPTSGPKGALVKVKGTALKKVSGSVSVVFSGTLYGTDDAGEGSFNREQGNDPDGTDGNDIITVSFQPKSSRPEPKQVTANVNGFSSNSDVIFTLTSAPAAAIAQVQVKDDALSMPYTTQNWGYVYSYVKLTGESFGATQGTGSIKIGGVIVPATNTDGTPNIYWGDKTIEFGIPRSVSGAYVESGPATIELTTGSGAKLTNAFTIKPKIFSVSPNSGAFGTNVEVSGVALGPEKTPITVNFGVIPLTATVTTRVADQPGNNGSDKITLSSPLGTPGVTVNVYVSKGTGLDSNSKDFTYLAVGAPTVTTIIPNAAPNSKDIDVVINGSKLSGATVTLNFPGKSSDITGKVDAVKSTATTLYVNLPITGKTAGKYDVVVSNGTPTTVSKGFTVLDSTIPGNETSQVIDGFEGTEIKEYVSFDKGTPPDPNAGNIAVPFFYKTDKANIYEGDQSANIAYNDEKLYRGYNGNLMAKQDVSSFSSIAFMVKGDGSVGKIKVQIATKNDKGDTKNFGADAAKNPKYSFSLSDPTKWSKSTIPFSDLVEIDSQANPIAGGITFDKVKSTYLITDYQVVFTGANTTVQNGVFVDLVAAGGYTAPVVGEPGKIDIKLNPAGMGNKHWVSVPYSNPYVSLADIIKEINSIPDITTGAGLTTPPTVCDYIARFNPATQKYESVYWSPFDPSDISKGVWSSDTDDPN